MKNIFFITGLPRSRTAWLANWFTYGDSFCFHEACRKVKSIDQLPALFESVDCPNVGTADCGFLAYHPEALKLFPSAKILVIERDQDMALESFDRFIEGYAEFADLPGLFANLQEKLWAVERLAAGDEEVSLDVSWAEFDDLSVESRMKGITEHLLGPNSFHAARFRELNDIRMNVMPERAIAGAKALGAHLLETLHVQALGIRDGSQMANGKLQMPESSLVTPAMAQFNQLLCEITAQTPGAYVWLQQLWECVLTWDHIVDGDPLDVPMAERAFEALWFHWPNNPFWQGQNQRLMPVLMNAVAAWRYANTTGNQARAYDIYTETACAVAGLVGGTPCVNKHSPVLRGLVDQIREEDK